MVLPAGVSTDCAGGAAMAASEVEDDAIILSGRHRCDNGVEGVEEEKGRAECRRVPAMAECKRLVAIAAILSELEVSKNREPAGM